MQGLDADTVAHLQASQDADYEELSFEGTLQLVSQAYVPPLMQKTTAYSKI